MTLRADAARNREAIVEAARAVFAEQGLEAPLDDIAKRAGTGNATLYRRFPTRADLVAAVFAERMAEHVDAVEAGLADVDPWDGFASYIRAVGAMQARDRGIADLVTMNVEAPEIEELRTRAYEGLVRLVARAHDAGVLRADFTDQDVVLLLMANAGLVERAHGITAEASARLLALVLDGLRAGAATAGPPAPPAGRVVAAMRRNGERRLGCGSRPKPGPGSAPTTQTPHHFREGRLT
ncbi:helix-turn-helix domain-containing protein [Isoptericola sp. b441]|uniref:TetR/AcrR family transcriptional regulator n=2 Tax=Cellulomonadaceae TaxID=85016 RepID=A0A7Y0LUX8_CELFI|nr:MULTISPECIES: TetR/AcrR family transcriptional regulator [Micrococcales]MDO8106392.1 helix-turn-helix domain-containing protein [Isoptericola sp. b441]NMR18672.1 TetR/AcrR family transcriptional regulator [Cellulomonas fimi]